ncbi:MAG: Rpn family recombination-promoting nuclease/putative transposase [Turicibacter sp.]|nr:Rpn family recombination-promoting nuclease/putative transposase [Turicibacter sp.]
MKLAVKDTAFRYMMKQDPKYTADTYKALTGKWVNPELIKPFNLEDRFEKSLRYNDVAFLLDGWNLLVLIEHQSTLNPNMCFRMLEYYLHLVDLYIRENHLKKFGTQEMVLPKAEFYVVYNGKSPLQNEVLQLDLGSIIAQAKVLDIHFDKLKDKSKDNALAGYARFVKHSKSMSVKDAIQKTREEGYLPEFFQEGKLINMFAEIFSYDNELKYEGKLEAEREKEYKYVSKLLKKGYDSETIKDLTEITDERLEEIKEEVKVNN